MKILFVPGSALLSDKVLRYDTEMRCKKALELWRTGGYSFIVVSGFWPGKASAAEAMQRWLVVRGVPREKILVEPEALDTYQNIELSLNLIKESLIVPPKSHPEIHVVTQWQQAIRSWITFRRYGVPAKLHPLHYRVSLLTAVTEYFYILYHLVDKRGTWFPARWSRKKRMAPGS